MKEFSVTTSVTDPIRGDSEPDRFWTTTNLGEACPDVMTPMCWSVWEQSAELGWLYSMSAFGVNADDFERDLMGSVRPGAPKFRGSPARIPVILVKTPVALSLTGRRLRDLYAEIYEKWTTTVFEPAAHQVGRPIDRLVRAREDFKRVFSVHCVWRFVFQAGQSAVTRAADNAGEPGLAVELLSGVGDVNETKMADDLWRLGKGEITEHEFLSSWGYHGPNEGNPNATVWRENPAPIRALAAGSAHRRQRPADRAASAQAVGAPVARSDARDPASRNTLVVAAHAKHHPHASGGQGGLLDGDRRNPLFSKRVRS
jgi:hypothetical protein